MRDDNWDDHEPQRGILWLLFCGPGALSMWFSRMFPRDAAQAISAHSRRDNIFVQFLMTIGIYLSLALLGWIWIAGTMGSGTPERPPIEAPARTIEVRSKAQPPSAPAQETPAPATPRMEESPSAELLGQADVIWSARPTARQFAAAFPQRALDRAQPGHVELDCLIETDGGLVCEVVSENPRSLGFGRGALELSRAFRVEPLDRTGAAVAGRRMRLPIAFAIE